MIGYLSKKKVFSAPYFDVFEETLERNGESHVHFNAQRKPIVCVFPITPKQELYLIKEVRPMLGRIVLACIAGHADSGEDIKKAAARELKEETGLEAGELTEFRVVDASASIFNSKSHLFLARDLSLGKAKPDVGEEIELTKMPLSEAIEKVHSGEITTQTSMIGILLLERLVKEGKI